jgi:hypothetical protein
VSGKKDIIYRLLETENQFSESCHRTGLLIFSKMHTNIVFEFSLEFKAGVIFFGLVSLYALAQSV